MMVWMVAEIVRLGLVCFGDDVGEIQFCQVSLKNGHGLRQHLRTESFDHERGYYGHSGGLDFSKSDLR
jgi:hypothetical protein